MLGLELRVADGEFGIVDPVTGTKLRSLDESEAALAASEAARQREADARHAAERRAEQAERRIAELQAKMRDQAS